MSFLGIKFGNGREKAHTSVNRSKRVHAESMMRHFCMLAVSLSCAISFSYDVTIVENTQPRAIIVLPPGAPSALIDAAREIVTYIEKATGAELQTGAGVRGQNQIVLEYKAARVGGGDSFRIRTRPGEIRLIGDGVGGAVFACYAFLEDLGFRWLVPGEDGEVIPKAKTLRYPQTDRAEKPSFIHRFFYVRSDAAARWALRNRINGFYKKEFAEAHGNLIYLPPIVRSIHSFAYILRQADTSKLTLSITRCYAAGG